MNGWLLDYHHVLEFRLLGMTMLLGSVATVGALACAVRNAGRRLLRQPAQGMPSCQRRVP